MASRLHHPRPQVPGRYPGSSHAVRGGACRGSSEEGGLRRHLRQTDRRARLAAFVGAPDAEGFDFREGTFLALAKENKGSWRHGVFRARAPVSFFRGKTFAQISPLLVEEFKSERRKSTITFKKKPERDGSIASVNRDLELLSRIFTLAIGTGMRRSGQLNLRKCQVDFQRNVIRVPNSKTGRGYPVPMNEDVRRVMLELVREDSGGEYLLVNPDTGQPYRDLKKGFAEACRLAGITGLRWHDPRHTSGTRLAEAGCPEATIAELMGHTDPKTTCRATHGTDRAKQAAVEALRLQRGDDREDAVHKGVSTEEERQRGQRQPRPDESQDAEGHGEEAAQKECPPVTR